MSTLNGKKVIVTGANSGMGMATAAALADMGATVVMLCDFGDFSSIKAFADAFRSKYKELDILVNNAGFISLNRQTTKDGLLMFYPAHIRAVRFTLKILILRRALM